MEILTTIKALATDHGMALSISLGVILVLLRLYWEERKERQETQKGLVKLTEKSIESINGLREVMIEIKSKI